MEAERHGGREVGVEMEIEKLCPLTGRPCDGGKCMWWVVMRSGSKSDAVSTCAVNLIATGAYTGANGLHFNVNP